mmetsp:Transcript_36760/g.92152  ORF Transcript_36760/g.92152 Transcript_36760/m.92152 type:complete len:142 (+) Transcript_36760:377-802(+)
MPLVAARASSPAASFFFLERRLLVLQSEGRLEMLSWEMETSDGFFLSFFRKPDVSSMLASELFFFFILSCLPDRDSGDLGGTSLDSSGDLDRLRRGDSEDNMMDLAEQSGGVDASSRAPTPDEDCFLERLREERPDLLARS